MTARLCPHCGHRTMGAGPATMQCTQCRDWDWDNMSLSTKQYLRRTLRAEHEAEQKAQREAKAELERRNAERSHWKEGT